MQLLLFALAVEVVAPNAGFVEPFGAAKDRAGNLYVCEHNGQKIMKVDPAGKVSRFAGTGEAGYGGDNGPALSASFRDPHGLVIGPGEQMYVADTLNHRVRKIDLRSGIITTIAGTGDKGYAGDGGPAVQARFDGVFAIGLGDRGRKLYVADLGNRRIRVVDLKTGVVTTAAGNGTRGVPADGGKATDSPLVDPRAVAADTKGNIYIVERSGNALRVVDKSGRIRTLIAPGSVQPGMKGPKHLCLDRDGSILIADTENHIIRRYARGALTTLDTGPLKRPHGVYLDRTGMLYISDSENHRVLRLRP